MASRCQKRQSLKRLPDGLDGPPCRLLPPDSREGQTPGLRYSALPTRLLAYAGDPRASCGDGGPAQGRGPREALTHEDCWWFSLRYCTSALKKSK